MSEYLYNGNYYNYFKEIMLKDKGALEPSSTYVMFIEIIFPKIHEIS